MPASIHPGMCYEKTALPSCVKQMEKVHAGHIQALEWVGKHQQFSTEYYDVWNALRPHLPNAGVCLLILINLPKFGYDQQRHSSVLPFKSAYTLDPCISYITHDQWDLTKAIFIWIHYPMQNKIKKKVTYMFWPTLIIIKKTKLTTLTGMVCVEAVFPHM